jgi:Mn2+/Fe2+ NRAMP family transporter
MFKSLQEKLGPGLLYAAVAVGVSHLVSSTTAGATYGIIMIGYMVLVCLVKYPTFLFGATYAAATGDTLVEGYMRMGKWVVVLFFFMQLFEYSFAISGVAVTTAAIFRSVFDIEAGIVVELGLVISCMLIVALGRYAVLEDVTRVLVIVFSIGTVIAALIAVGGIDAGNASLSASITEEFSPDKKMATILFLIAVAGWRATGTAGAGGRSLWVKAKSIRLKRPVTPKEAAFDFHVGYGTAIFLAICFVALGTYVMYINGTAVESNGSLFAAQLINLFTSTMGDWIYPVIALAAITVMYSTLLTLVDLMPRSSAAALVEIFPVPEEQESERFSKLYLIFIGVELLFVMTVLFVLLDDFGTFIFWVTSMGFVVAPIFSFLNHKAMFSSDVQAKDRPPEWLRWWSIGTISILAIVAVMFVYMTYLM